MTTILTILFLIPFWIFWKFWSKFLHEFDLVLESVYDKTVKIYSDRSFCLKTWGEWHSQIKLMKILGISVIILFSFATQIFVVGTMLFDIQNGIFKINLVIGIMCLVPLIIAIYYAFRKFNIFLSVDFRGIKYVMENNKNVLSGCELETKSIAFIKTLDIKRPYPSNKMIMTYEFRKLDYNWNTEFTGKFDMLVSYYVILYFTIGMGCLEILGRIAVGCLLSL